jgi:hypothetical protein
MSTFNKITLKFTTFLLVVLFAAEGFALWDAVEQAWAETHFLGGEVNSSIYPHDSKDNANNSQPFDSCPLCPCCVSHVHMTLSFFTLSEEKPDLGILTSEAMQIADFSEKNIFHPPRYPS